MSCPQPDLTFTPNLYITPNKDTSLPFTGQLYGNIPLMCSDNWETIHVPPDPAGTTLWLYPMTNAGPGQIVQRVFSWHQNSIGSTTNVALTLENTNAFPLTVSIKKQGGNNPNSVCIAKALLGNTLDNYDTVTVAPITDAPNNVGLLDATILPTGGLMGAQYELTVSAVGVGYPLSFGYNLREVYANPPTQFISIKSPPVSPLPPPQAHPRGSWPQSEILSTCTLKIDGSYPPDQANYYFNLMNNVDDGAFSPQNSVNQQAIQNPAAFGGIYRAALQINNQTADIHELLVFLNPRGGGWNGAIQSTTLVPSVSGVNIPPAGKQSINSVKLGTLTVQPGVFMVGNIVLATGGGSSSPIALALTPLS